MKAVPDRADRLEGAILVSKRRKRLLQQRNHSCFTVASLVFWLLLAPASQAQQPSTGASTSKAGNGECAHGQAVFSSNCAACHGLDGRGTERAPNVVDGPTSRRLSNSQISGIIREGIAAGGMPAFQSLSGTDVDAIVRFLRCQSGTNEEGKAPGDPITGKHLFFGKASCSHCHMAEGKGGFIASDLSQYGRTHSPQQIGSAIVNPKDSPTVHMRLATATLREGGQIVGRVRNEDNFSIQIQSLDGAFHFVSKSAIGKLEYDQKLLMPGDYGSVLTSKEVDDLISYLLSVSGESPTSPENHDDDE